MFVYIVNIDLIPKKVTLLTTFLLEQLLQTCQKTGFAQNAQLLELKHLSKKKNKSSSQFIFLDKRLHDYKKSVMDKGM